LLQITLITIIVTVSLNLLGVNNALLIGIFAALINVIPYLGPLIGAAFGIMITVSSNLDLSFYNEMLPMLLKVMGVFATMQLLDNFIFQPFIFSTSVRAHPLEIFLVILIGAQIQGITGMVLAIPTYTVIRVVAREFLNKFEIVQHITSRMGREVKVEAVQKKDKESESD
jgi:predicted PurR-regulated permease PerM